MSPKSLTISFMRMFFMDTSFAKGEADTLYLGFHWISFKMSQKPSWEERGRPSTHSGHLSSVIHLLTHSTNIYWISSLFYARPNSVIPWCIKYIQSNYTLNLYSGWRVVYKQLHGKWQITLSDKTQHTRAQHSCFDGNQGWTFRGITNETEI